MGLVAVLERMGYAPKDKYGIKQAVQIPELAKKELERLVWNEREMRRSGFRLLNCDFGRVLMPLMSKEEQLLAKPRVARQFVWDMIRMSFDYELGEKRTKALPQLEEAGAAALPALGEALRSKDARIRRAAVMGANEVGQKAMPLVYGATSDSDAGVRCDAAWCLWKWRGHEKQVAERLEQMLSDPDEWVRRNALYSLMQISGFADENIQRAVAEMAKNEGDKWLRWEAERFLDDLRKRDKIAKR